MRNAFLIIIIGTISSQYYIDLACSQDSIVDEFKTEAPKAWHSYLVEMSSYQASFAIIINGVVEKECIIMSYPPFHLYQVDAVSEEERTKNYILAANDNYRFRISPGKNDDWNLLDMSTRSFVPQIEDTRFVDNTKADEAASETFYRTVAFTMLRCLMVTRAGADIMPVLMEKPDFTIINCEEVYENNMRLVRIEYEYEPEVWTPNQLVRSGEVYFMPDHYWLIKKALVQAVDYQGQEVPDTITVTNEYHDLQQNALPIVKSHKLIANGEDYDNYTLEYVFHDIQKTPVDSTEKFYLSYYGLPEPGEANGPSLRLIFVVVSLILLAIVVYRMSVRKQRGS